MSAAGELRRIGVEEELLLVDAGTLAPVPVAGRIFAFGALEPAPGVHTPASGVLLEAEVKHEQIEAEWRSGLAPDQVPTGVLRAASWRASRYGLSDSLLDPASRTLRPAAEVARSLLADARGGFADAEEDWCAAERLAVILRRGSGAGQQRAAVEGGPIGAAVRLAVEIENEASI